MNDNFASELARKAIVRISASLANDADSLANDIERQAIPMTGPQALRMFAAGVRKAADDAEESEIIGECDCCGEKKPLSRCWAYGIETFACDECRDF